MVLRMDDRTADVIQGPFPPFRTTYHPAPPPPVKTKIRRIAEGIATAVGLSFLLMGLFGVVGYLSSAYLSAKPAKVASERPPNFADVVDLTTMGENTRFAIMVPATFKDPARPGVPEVTRNLYIIQDRATGATFLGVTGIGLVEVNLDPPKRLGIPPGTTPTVPVIPIPPVEK